MSSIHNKDEMLHQIVKQVLKGEKSVAIIAKVLGISQNTVSRWIKEYRK